MEKAGSVLGGIIRAALAADDAIAAVYLFGSHARGTATKLSDVDIALLLDAVVDKSSYFPLRLEYTARMVDLLGSERVEVVVLNEVPLHLAYEIISRGTLLVERNRRYRTAFEADRIGRFLDFKPFLAAQFRAVKQQLRKGTFFD